jgi:hypothetical protein
MNFAEAGEMIEVGAKAAAPEMAERVSARENFILCLVFCILDVVLCVGAIRYYEN